MSQPIAQLASLRAERVLLVRCVRCMSPDVARLNGPAVRCKLDLMIWRRLVLRFCIRPLNGAFVLLAIMDIRAHPISF
jgi:hypothetical protein